jgi:PAS domain S-box-containing protein
MLVEADAASIRLVDAAERSLVVVANHGVSEAFAKRPPLAIESSPPLVELMNGRPVSFGDVTVVGDDRNRDELVAEGLCAAATVPLLSRERSVGILTVFSRTPREYAETDLERLKLFANFVAIAIENKRAEENLRSAHAETEQLLASISWIMLAVDDDGVVTQWNAAAEAAFGLPASRAVGSPVSELPISWSWPSLAARIAACRGSESPGRFSELAYTRVDGRRGVLGLTLMPIHPDDASRSGLLLLASDITERRMMEDQLAQAQRLESIGQLAAGVAHEINTPIQFIGDNLRFLGGAVADLWRLLDAYRPLLDDELIEVTERQRRSSAIRHLAAELDMEFLGEEMPTAITQAAGGIERVASIVRALKDFAHPDQRTMVATDLNEVLQSTLTVARSEVRHVADVETDFGALSAIMCNPGEIQQVFLNILVNAAHAVADRAAVEGGRGRIVISTAEEGDEAVVAIADNGGGIPERVQPRIFDPFFTTKEVGRGTGQGLAIARTVVERHRGTLTFETEVGRGTTFFIRLPLTLEAAAAPTV